MKRKLDFDILESLRGIAALYVCIGHCRGLLWIGGEHFQRLHPRSTWTLLDYFTIGLNMLTRLSTEFVIVFFVLSGFSIAHSLRKNQEALGFYKRRFIRLYPPYVTALLWAMGVGLVLRAIYPHFFDGTYDTVVFDRLENSNSLYSLPVIIRNLVYYPKLGGLINPFWSLTHEVIFYLLAPFALRNRKVYYALSIVGYVIGVTGIHGLHWQTNIPLNFAYYNLFFAVGVWLYHNFDMVVERIKLLTTRFALVLTTGLFFSMIAFSLLKLHQVSDVLAGCLSCTLIVYLVYNEIRIKPLISIGRYSYTLYITHVPTIFLYMAAYYQFTSAEPPYIFNNLVFIPCVFVCLFVAFLQYSAIEKQTKRLLDRLRAGGSPPVPAEVVRSEKQTM